MASLKRQENYLRRDDRNSGGTLFEGAVATCAHCQRGVLLHPDRSRPRGYCAKCDHYICDRIECVLECRPVKQLFDELDRQAHHGTVPAPHVLLTGA